MHDKQCITCDKQGSLFYSCPMNKYHNQPMPTWEVGYHQYNMFIIYNSNEKKLCFNDPWYLKSWCLTATINTTAGYSTCSKKVISFPKGSLETNFEVPKHKKIPQKDRCNSILSLYYPCAHYNFKAYYSGKVIQLKSEDWGQGVIFFFLISWAGKDPQDFQKPPSKLRDQKFPLSHS